MRRRSATMVAAAAAAAVCLALFTGVSAAAAGTHAAAAVHAAASGGRWGTAKEVPGLAALNKGGNAAITSVSCGAAGNCSAGGFYADGTFSNQQAFVVSEKNGTWGTAKEAPGTAALNQTGNAEITSVSCASAGNCSAGGSYQDFNGVWAFVIGEKNGTWGTAKKVPGIAALNQGGDARIPIGALSCASAGNCSAGGSYEPNPNTAEVEGFVVVESNGTWGTAKEVPGLAALNQGLAAGIASVSCGAAGNCSAVGEYYDSSGHQQGFVIGEKNGTWGTAKKVPGLAALNQGGFAAIDAVSCASAGNCSAGGEYYDRSIHEQVFIVGETNGTWGTAKKVPGTAALNQGGGAAISSVSCASAGNCSAGGQYADRSGHGQAFIVSETNGTWGTAEEVPGTAALNQGTAAAISSVSCASAGNCSAGGGYQEASIHGQAFVVGETNGTWGTAKEVPGTAALNQGGDAGISSVSCASAGNCSAGGSYTDGSLAQQAFVVSES